MNTLMKPEIPLLRRLSRDLDTLFDRFVGLRTEPFLFETEAFWTPLVEVLEKGNEFVIRVEVPGLKKEEIGVEFTETELVLKGERKRVKEEKDEGYYRTERSYGSFYRTIPLPEGVKPDLAKAVIRDGVLEVKMPIAKVLPTVKKLTIEEPASGEKAVKHAA